MHVKKYLRGGHYHLIVDDYGNEYISVGLISDKPSDKNKYHKRTANYNVYTQTELKTFLVAKKIQISPKDKVLNDVCCIKQSIVFRYLY